MPTATGARPSVSPAAIQQTVEQLIAAQKSAIAAQKFDVVGTVLELHIEGKGTMNFGRIGPVIGAAQPIAFNTPADQLLLLGDWNGLPETIEPVLDSQKRPKPCRKCLVACDLCGAKGERPCNYTGCGGRGTIEAGTEKCLACKGKGLLTPKKACAKCGGRGVLPNLVACPGCKGAKKVVCPGCQGTKLMPAGFLDAKGKGTTARDAKECPSCRGQKHELKITPQPWEQFVQGRLGARLVFGPIARIVYRDPHDPVMKNRIKVIVIHPDAEGRKMTLILDSPKTGSRGYFVGGTWK